MPTHGEAFDTGAEVPVRGLYVCAPCGYKKTLEPGEIFPECDSCTRDKTKEAEADPDDIPEPSGIWEYVSVEDADESTEEVVSEDDDTDEDE